MLKWIKITMQYLNSSFNETYIFMPASSFIFLMKVVFKLARIRGGWNFVNSWIYGSFMHFYYLVGLPNHPSNNEIILFLPHNTLIQFQNWVQVISLLCENCNWWIFSMYSYIKLCVYLKSWKILIGLIINII